MSLFTPFSYKILKLSLRYSKFTVRTITTSKVLESVCTLIHSPNSKLNKNVIDRYMCLPLPECTCSVEYVWIDGTGENVRSKARTLDFIPESHKEIPNWSYNSDATFQHVGKDNDVLLTPVAIYNDPFRRSCNKIVLCEVYEFDGKPLPTNHRRSCAEAMNKVCDQELMWGIEQQFLLMDFDGQPFGWPTAVGEPRTRDIYYCGVGANRAYAREIIESFYRACLYAGVQIAGINPEITPSQWEYHIGICSGIKGADDLWMARYILSRISEEYGVNISYDPQAISNWHGSGCHINLSTKTSRADNGLTALETYIQKLSKRHNEHMKKYDPRGGTDNKRRLTGKDGTSSAETFTNGMDRSVSVRISKSTAGKKKGHFEDRRPASNCDPYAACDIIVRTCLLDEC